MMKKAGFFLSAVMLTAAAGAFADDSDLVCIPGGPCLDRSEAEKLEGEKLPDNLPGTTEEIRTVDLEKEPWLVESVNLPANHPAFKRDKVVFADKLMMAALPDVVPAVDVEKWLTPLPSEEERAGKFLLIEVWATWCPPCRRSLNYLNWIAEHYKDDVVVVAICEMEENKVRSMPGDHDIDHVKYSLAIDTGRRFANALHVTGIPHVVLVEPVLGGVLWEGMPTMPGHELDGKTLDKIFAMGRKLRDAGRCPEKPVIRFEVSEPTDEQRATRRHHESDAEDNAGQPSVE